MLEKLKSTFDKGITTVSVKSEVMVENSRIRSQIQNLEQQRAALVSRLGSAMYEMWGNNSFSRETFEQFCQEIRNCELAIAEQNRRLEQIRQEEQQLLGAQPQYQQPQYQPPQQQAQGAGPACSCGNLNPPGARFCTKCGRKFG